MYGGEDSHISVLPWAPGIAVTMGGFTMGHGTIPTQEIPDGMRIRVHIESSLDVLHQRSASTRVRAVYTVQHLRSVRANVKAVYEVRNHRTVSTVVKGIYDVLKQRAISLGVKSKFSVVPSEPTEPLVEIIKFLGTLQPGEEIIIDFENMTAKLKTAGGEIVNVLNLTDGSFFKLLAGINTIEISDSAQTRDLVANIIWREKHL